MRPRVLFRLAAGPRIGYGHLMRSATLAQALGVAPVVSIRGRHAGPVASGLGFRVASGDLRAALRRTRPSLVIVDDPSSAAALRAVMTARRAGVRTASIHDLGIARCSSDLSIDGTIAPGKMDLAGVRFAVLHPQVRRLAARRRPSSVVPERVVVALGGAPPRRLMASLVREIARRRPWARIEVAYGFQPRRSARPGSAVAVKPRDFRKALAAATAAVLAGGVTVYEACALGIPAVGISITAGQRKTIAGLARRGAILDAGAARDVARTAARAARLLDELMDAPERRRRLGITARRLVDGRGAARVARALRALASEAERAA